jgi:CRP-like cAMP-binding protein
MKAPAAANPIPGQPPATAEIQPNAGPGEETAQSQALYELIARQPFFQGLMRPQLQLLAASAMEMQFTEGQSVLEEGTPANRFFLILEGKVAQELEVAADGTKLLIQTLGPGDDIGWSWLFPPYSVHLGARALEPTKTIFFYGTRLREQCEQDHELGYQLMKRIAEVATQCLQATQQSLIAFLDIDKIPEPITPEGVGVHGADPIA